MSTKKEKLIEEAQRMALRGQLDKAIKAYEQLLALEPSAINHRQRRAELLVKAGRSDDAREEFEKIGKHYASNGFYLKAIAVYKQVQKLFSADISITLILADLNEKHGLISNALAEYKQVYDYYEKNAQTTESIKILEKMQGVEPGNITIRLKLAEAYLQADKKNESYSAFGKLAALLLERGDTSALAKINVRVQQLFPEKTGFMLEVLADQIEHGNIANAVISLQSLLRVNPNEKRVWELIVTAYQRLNKQLQLKNAYQHFLKYFPDELSAKVGYISCIASENNLKGALDLIDRDEPALLVGGYWQKLVEIYQVLEKIDPINARILTGMQKALESGGEAAAASALTPRIKSISDFSSVRTDQAQPDPDEAATLLNVDFSGLSDDVVEGDLFAAEIAAEAVPEQLDEEDLEVEIDFDDLDGFEDIHQTLSDDISNDDWLNSVGKIFDSIATAPRSVKFDNSFEGADLQSHYDLGVAFKEMGLYDEALNEFRQASVDNTRKIQCLVLQGACLREKGELEKAENVLRSLMKPGLSLEDTCSIKYELAMVCSVSGKQDESAALFADIEALNPGFRDVRSLLNATVNDDELLDFSDEELQGFDLK